MAGAKAQPMLAFVGESLARVTVTETRNSRLNKAELIVCSQNSRNDDSSWHRNSNSTNLSLHSIFPNMYHSVRLLLLYIHW